MDGLEGVKVWRVLEGGRGGGRWQTLRTALNGRPGALQGGGIGLGELGWWAAMTLRTALNGRPRVRE